MTSIRKDISIDAPAVEVWDAVRDFGAQMVLGVSAMQKVFVRKQLATPASDCDLSHRGCSA